MKRPLDFVERERNFHVRNYQNNATQYVIDYIDYLYSKEGWIETSQEDCVTENQDRVKGLYITEITINDLKVSNSANNKKESKLGACEKIRLLLDEEYGNLVDLKMMFEGAEALKVRPKRIFNNRYNNNRKRSFNSRNNNDNRQMQPPVQNSHLVSYDPVSQASMPIPR